ncbi:DUF397 domain-containing protein [Streptomyces flavidovirens]|uniref:DUF397 domain-containing protein n=1 Tax=Streptomyces flavidovirens TaxID=67298 RepID=UPI00343663D4
MNHDGTQWIKSSYSGGSGTECVEVAGLDGCAPYAAVRDSKVPDGARIAVSRGAWVGFVRAVRGGEFAAR